MMTILYGIAELGLMLGICTVISVAVLLVFAGLARLGR